MYDLGVLGLDTSHAEAFASVLVDRPDARLTHAWDGGRVRTDEWTSEYATTHGLELVDEPADVMAAVDGVLVLAVDWERHLELATLALEGGVPVLVDKPVVGSGGDLKRLRDATSSTGTPLFGGSALPWHPMIDALPAGPGERFLAASGYGDPFYYGVHLVDAIRHVIDADWERVAPVDVQRGIVAVRFGTGAVATCHFDGPADAATFAFLDVTCEPQPVLVESSSETLQAMYEPYLDAFLACVRGDRDRTATVLDAAELLLAVQACLESGATIERPSSAIESVTIPSTAFVAQYEPYY